MLSLSGVTARIKKPGVTEMATRWQRSWPQRRRAVRHEAIIGLATIAATFYPALAAAQIRLGADATFSTRYVWRGLTRTSQPVLQPQAHIGLHGASGYWTVGAWTSLEPFRADATDLSDRGSGRRGLGEFNYWAEYARSSGRLEYAVGWTGYIFDNNASRGGRGSDFNSGEVYGRLWFTHLPLIAKTAIWYDVDRVKGAYLETRLDLRIPLLPLRLGPLRTLYLTGLAGWSVGQELNDSGRADRANFAEGGLTHVAFSIWSSFYLAPAWSLAPALHLQVNRDELTRRTSADPSDLDKSIKLWVMLQVSWSHSLGAAEAYP